MQGLLQQCKEGENIGNLKNQPSPSGRATMDVRKEAASCRSALPIVSPTHVPGG